LIVMNSKSNNDIDNLQELIASGTGYILLKQRANNGLTGLKKG